jgi:hypothetical protein
MHHFVQLTPSNAYPSVEAGNLLPVPQSLLELGGSHSNLEDPLPSPQLVLSRRQSLPFILPCSPVTIQMSNNQCKAPPHSFPGGLPLCKDNFGADPLTISESDLLFCTLFQNYKNIPNFETSFQPFPFQKPSPSAASPSLHPSEPPQEKDPTLRATLDCGHESGQGVWGAVLPRKEPILLPLRDSAKITQTPPNPPLCWQSIKTGEAAPAWSQRDCGGRVRDRERERHDQSRPGETPLDRASLAKTCQHLLAECGLLQSGLA